MCSLHIKPLKHHLHQKTKHINLVPALLFGRKIALHKMDGRGMKTTKRGTMQNLHEQQQPAKSLRKTQSNHQRSAARNKLATIICVKPMRRSSQGMITNKPISASTPSAQSQPIMARE